MATVAQKQTRNQARAENQDIRSTRQPFLSQLGMLTWRALIVNLRTPSAILPPLLIGIFFVVIYEAQLGRASNFIPGLRGNAYINFILPLSIVSSSLSGAGVAGQSLVRDIENGYFDKLLLTPLSRAALVLGPTLAGAIILMVQTLAIIAVGYPLGLDPATGLAGILAVVGLSLLLGVGFSGFTIGLALLTGNAAATQSGSFLFFPLTFLTSSFVPINQLSGWLEVAARLNPITYILEGMRTILLQGWETQAILYAVAACLGLSFVTFVFSLFGLRLRTSRQ